MKAEWDRTKEKLGDSWETPQWLFDELNEEFGFVLDLCATYKNKKCAMFCADYLTTDILAWNTYFCNSHLIALPNKTYFMNPPYSNPYPFVRKAWGDSQHCRIVLVLPAKTDTKWWRIFWSNCDHCPKDGCEVRFMPYRQHHKSRVSFINLETGKEQSGNPCGTAIVIFDRR